MKKLLFISLCSMWLATQAQQADQDVKKGNDLYRSQQYEQAKESYEKALQAEPANSAAKFNLASAEYRLKNIDGAVRDFDELAANSKKDENKARAWYNKGAILSDQKKLEESIEAYKSALRLNPNDKEARENLQKALLELKKKNPPPKKEDQKKKKQDNKKQQQQPKMNQRDAEQKLKLLEQKEKELQQKMQKQKSTLQSGAPKDW